MVPDNVGLKGLTCRDVKLVHHTVASIKLTSFSHLSNAAQCTHMVPIKIHFTLCLIRLLVRHGQPSRKKTALSLSHITSSSLDYQVFAQVRLEIACPLTYS